MSKKVNIEINGQPYEVDSVKTILYACRAAGYNIPTLCYMNEGLGCPGSCRICVVEVEGARTLVPSCSSPVADGMKIFTNTQRVIEARKMNYQLLMAGHEDCVSCAKNGNCDLQRIGEDLGVRSRLFSKNVECDIDDSAVTYYRDNEKCILCQKCVNVCSKVVGVNSLNFINRGHETRIGHAFNAKIAESNCVNCGQCVINCPVGALVEKSYVNEVRAEMAKKEKMVIVQTAPAVRAALGEEFGMEAGTLVTGKMVEALKRLGFDKVLDTTLGADFTIMEEGYEALKRIGEGGTLPMFTSCCPAWVKFVEDKYPEIIPHLSTAKSPHQMFGSVIKWYYSKLYEVDPENIVTVSIMPCIAKKYESARPEMDSGTGIRDVDYVITTRELAKMIKTACIDFARLPDSNFDDLGDGSGAGDIFGVTGGVMEAALRTGYEVGTGKKLERLEFHQIRGHKKVKEGSIIMNGKELNFLVVTTLKEAEPYIKEVIAGTSKYHCIEVMACPAGCISGGGQPMPANRDVITKRMHALYRSDEQKVIRRSYENPIIKKVYSEFFGEPLSEKAEKHLHNDKYVNRRDNFLK